MICTTCWSDFGLLSEGTLFCHLDGEKKTMEETLKLPLPEMLRWSQESIIECGNCGAKYSRAEWDEITRRISGDEEFRARAREGRRIKTFNDAASFQGTTE